jgi:exonuclease III
MCAEFLRMHKTHRGYHCSIVSGMTKRYSGAVIFVKNNSMEIINYLQNIILNTGKELSCEIKSCGLMSTILLHI